MSTNPRPVAHVRVAVTFTDRTRDADGRFVTDTHDVIVTDDDGDPTLVAAQQVGARIVAQFDGMVLGAVIVDARI